MIFQKIMGTSTLIRIILRYKKALFDTLIKEKVIYSLGLMEISLTLPSIIIMAISHEES